MKPLLLGREEVESLLPFSLLIPRMKEALTALASGQAKNPPRQVLPVAGGALGLMPAASEALGLLGAKVVGVFPGNETRGLNPHQGSVLLQNSETGLLEAVLDGSAITARRTAAVSAGATDQLARPEANSLALFGTGLQARLHAEAMHAVRPLKRLFVYGRDQEKAAALAHQLAADLKVPARATTSPAAALERADLACLCTAATYPYLSSDQLPPGIHVNAIGACRPGMREIELTDRPELEIYVDHLPSSELEAEELSRAIQERRLSSHRIAGEIGTAFAIRPPRHARTITLFKAVGVGISDLAAARLVLQRKAAYA